MQTTNNKTITRSGFTLIEIMVAISIMAMLAALVFPAFNRARENARQNSCSSNLHKIYQAVRLYFDDEKRYPGSLAFILPDNAELNGGLNTFGTGYFKGTSGDLKCLSDQFRSTEPRSSYGDISVNLTAPTTGGKNAMNGTNYVNTTDTGRYVWNALGYDQDGYAYLPADINSKFSACSSGTPCKELVDPNKSWRPKNPVRYSLSNRFAPANTIITHCINHRFANSDLDYPGELSVSGRESAAQGARDLILRLDGAVKNYDVSTFTTGVNRWQDPAF